MKFIRKYKLTEGYFKSPEELKTQKNKLSAAEKLVNAAKLSIPERAAKRFNTEFTEYMTGVNSVFYDENGPKCQNIEYYFENNMLVCKFTIELNYAAHSFGGISTNIFLRYPDNIRTIEESLEEEYGYKVKVVINLVPGTARGSEEDRIFGVPSSPEAYNARRTITVNLTDGSLTDFCHLLNCITGLEYWKYYSLTVKNGDLIKSNEELTTEPLVHKFHKINIINLQIIGTGIKNIDYMLSNEVSEYFFTLYIYRWHLYLPKLAHEITDKLIPSTGILEIINPPIDSSDFPEYEIADRMQIEAEKYAEWLNKNAKSFENLYLHIAMSGVDFACKKSLFKDKGMAYHLGANPKINTSLANASLILTFQNPSLLPKAIYNIKGINHENNS